MKTYQDITHDEFAASVLELARNKIDETLSLPGVWEIISEHYNNEALDLCVEERRNKRKEQIGNSLTRLHAQGFI